MLTEIDKPWNPDTGLVFKSKQEKIVIGRWADGEFIELDDVAIDICAENNIRYDTTLVCHKVEEEGSEEVEEVEGEGSEEVEEAEGEEEVEEGGSEVVEEEVEEEEEVEGEEEEEEFEGEEEEEEGGEEEVEGEEVEEEAAKVENQEVDGACELEGREELVSDTEREVEALRLALSNLGAGFAARIQGTLGWADSLRTEMSVRDLRISGLEEKLSCRDQRIAEMEEELSSTAQKLTRSQKKVTVFQKMLEELE